MLEFIILLLVAVICYAIPYAGHKEPDVMVPTTKAKPKKAEQQPQVAKTQEPQSTQGISTSIDSLYLNEDFDISDLINAGKENDK